MFKQQDYEWKLEYIKRWTGWKELYDGILLLLIPLWKFWKRAKARVSLLVIH